MPHHFRTIEQFVQLLEDRKDGCFTWRGKCASHSQEYYRGAEDAYRHVLSILRTSNIGIVYPPPEDK
jgi:hypothetical protein